MLTFSDLLKRAEEATWENIAELERELFPALALFGATSAEVEGVLRAMARSSGVSLQALLADWKAYLGPKEGGPLSLILENTPLQLWRTPDQEAWVSLKAPAGHMEHHPVRSRGFELYVARAYFEATGKPPRRETLGEVLRVLEAKALFEGEEHPVHVRVAEHAGRIYLDLSRPDWKVVEVGPGYWTVREAHEVPVRFRRSRYQRPLPIPEEGGEVIPHLKPLLNLGEGEEAERGLKLVLGFLLGALHPKGPYPILFFTGPQGTGKSTAARILKRLLDPYDAELRSLPKAEGDLVVQAKVGWILAFDNLSHLPGEMSDALARLSTGGGIGKRRLYTDDEEHVLGVKRPVILTSITDLATKDDLLDRAMRVELHPIPEEERLPEAELWAEVERVHPQILGGLLDAAAFGLGHLPTARERLPRLPRLADWALWVAACSPALGYEEREIVDEFFAVQASFDSELLDKDPLAQAVLKLVEESPYTALPPAELLSRLEELVGIKPEGWPRTPEALTRRLVRLAPALRTAGVVVERGERGRGGRRAWVVRRVEGE